MLVRTKISEIIVFQAVLQRVAGPPGTLVVMNFKNHRTAQVLEQVACVQFASCSWLGFECGYEAKLLKTDANRSFEQHYDVIALRHLPIQGDRMPMPQMAEIGHPRSATTSYPEIPALGRF